MTALTLVFAASACTMTDQLRREDAKVLGAQTARVQRELTAFAEAREKTVAARHVTVNRLQQSELEMEAGNERKVRVWIIKDDKERQQMFKDLLAGADATLARQRDADAVTAAGSALVANARSRVNTRSEQLTAVTKNLARLAEQQKITDQIKFVVTFFQEVDQSMKEVRASAEIASAKATVNASGAAIRDKSQGGEK